MPLIQLILLLVGVIVLLVAAVGVNAGRVSLLCVGLILCFLAIGLPIFASA